MATFGQERSFTCAYRKDRFLIRKWTIEPIAAMLNNLVTVQRLAMVQEQLAEVERERDLDLHCKGRMMGPILLRHEGAGVSGRLLRSGSERWNR
jgi:hypothetical protein